MSQLSASRIQSMGASTSAIVFTMNIQESFQWLSLGLLNHMATLKARYGFPGEGNGNPLQYSCLENLTGQRSLVGYSPWGHKELDTIEWLHFHFSLSCIGEGNGNPLQCSCLENPRDGRAWWAAICGVAQSQTWLKRLSSSSSSMGHELS